MSYPLPPTPRGVCSKQEGRIWGLWLSVSSDPFLPILLGTSSLSLSFLICSEGESNDL